MENVRLYCAVSAVQHADFMSCHTGRAVVAGTWGGTNTHTLHPWAVLGQEQSWLCAVWSVAVRGCSKFYQIRSCGNIL